MQTTQKKRSKQNIVGQYLDNVEIPYTSLKLNEVIRVQPEGDSLLGISDVLNEYNIKNLSIKIDPTDLANIDPPFIAHFQLPEPQFVIVTRQENNQITYTKEDNSTITESPADFIKQWSKVVLLAEPNEDSKEKNYQVNRRREIIENLRLPVCLSVFAFILIFLAYRNYDPQSVSHAAYAVLGLSFLAGTIISFLLMVQTIYHNNGLLNKICDLVKNSNCNNVLYSPAAKFLGTVSWSDIGLIYFSGSLLTLTLVAQVEPVLLLLNLCALPYTVWSIYYQRQIAKQWCVLCLTIQALIWVTCVSLIAGGPGLQFGLVSQSTLIETALCFLFPLAAAWAFKPFALQAEQVIPLQQEINNLKANENIFRASLESQPSITITGNNACICFGELNAPFVVTLVTNPFCGPCADMHKRLNELLEKYGHQLRVQTIYAGSSGENDARGPAIKHLIAVYLQYPSEEAERIYADWYHNGKSDPAAFSLKYPVKIEDPEAETIFQSHNQWCNEADITATPTIYINGYRLPSWYTVEDLKYFIK